MTAAGQLTLFDTWWPVLLHELPPEGQAGFFGVRLGFKSWTKCLWLRCWDSDRYGHSTHHPCTSSSVLISCTLLSLLKRPAFWILWSVGYQRQKGQGRASCIEITVTCTQVWDSSIFTWLGLLSSAPCFQSECTYSREKTHTIKYHSSQCAVSHAQCKQALWKWNKAGIAWC